MVILFVTMSLSQASLSEILIGLVPNLGLEWTNNDRTQIKMKPLNHSAPTWVKTIWDRSFYSRGPRLYDTLPSSMRKLKDTKTPTKRLVEHFKVKLDKYLWKIIHKPAGLTSNIIHCYPKNKASNTKVIFFSILLFYF